MAHDEELNVYDQLCISYRAIDDFRAKLLGFLPLVSGSGAFVLLNDAFTDAAKTHFSQQFLRPIGLFGFVVTLGLFCYEVYGIRKCHALINAGRDLEILLGIEAGQFRRRPRSVAYLINEPFAAGMIYPAVLAAWTFVAQVFPEPGRGPATEAALALAIRVFVVGFALTLIYTVVLAYGPAIRKLLWRRKAAQPNL
jgi:hypothetical protein